MYRGFFPKAPKLGEPESENTARDILHDAADGMERISLLMLLPSGGATIVFPLYYGLGEAAIVLAFSLPVLASCVAVIIGAQRLEKMSVAPLLVTIGTVVPLLALAVLGAIYLFSGGLAEDPILGGFLAVPMAIYAFGLARLRRSDVRAYFWERRERAIDEDPTLMGEIVSDEEDEEDVVFAHEAADAHEEAAEVASSKSAR